MGERWDRVRSLVRDATDGVKGGVLKTGLAARLDRVRNSLKTPRLLVPSRAVSPLALGLVGVRTVGSRHQSGALVLDFELDSGEWLSVRIAPSVVRFVPRGPKEVTFRVDPEEKLSDPRVREVAGRLAGLIAHSLFTAAVGPYRDDASAFVEASGSELVCDLRTVPAVRAAEAKAPLLIEAVLLDRFAFESEGLALYLALPTFR